MNTIFDGKNDLINLLVNSVGHISFNDLIMTCDNFAKCSTPEIVEKNIVLTTY